MLISLTDLDQMGQSAVAQFQEEVGQMTSEAADDFGRQIERLEARLEQLYAVAATLAQKEANLENVAAIWAQMVSICDRSAQAVSRLRQAHGGAGVFSHDRILDIRNACEENRALHA